MSGEMWFSALAGAGQNIARGIDRARTEKKQETDILKESQGRGKAIVAALEGLEELGVAPEGASLKVRQAQENLSPKEFLGFVDQQARQLGAIIQGGVEMRRIQEQEAAGRAKAMQELAKQQEQQRVSRAVQMATDTAGNVAPGDALQAYAQLGGQDMKSIGEALKSLDSVRPEADFKASGYNVEMPGGKQVPVIQTSRGGVQVQAPAQDTAAITNLKNRTAQIAQMRGLLSEGKIDEAHDIAIAMQLPGMLGGLISRDDLIRQFGGTKPGKTADEEKAPAAKGAAPKSRFKIVEQK